MVDLVNTIKMNPTDYLVIIPFGASKKFNEDHPMAGALYTELIKTFGFDLEGLTIAKPMPTTALKSDFGAPWVYILKEGSNDLQSFLLWQQTFAAKSKIAFSVVPFDTSPQSWIIANISSDAVSKDPKVMNRALGVIKKNLWLNQDFRRVANRCLTKMGTFVSPAECAVRVTETFDLYFMPNLTNDEAAPMWILMGKPIMRDNDLHRQYLCIIRGATYFLGMHKLEFEKRWLDCVWCKCDTHPAHQCPLPKMDDWLGPKLTRDERLDMHSSTLKGMGKPANRSYPDGDSHYSRNVRGRGGWGARGHGGRGRGRK